MSKPESKKKDAGVQKWSAGILVFRHRSTGTEVLLAHPGGPFWKNKDAGSWTIPKGEPSPGESAFATAHREFMEETGWDPGMSEEWPLSPVRQKAGKWIHSWAIEGDRSEAELHSNFFSLEWPPHSGRNQSFPEMDRFEWMTLDAARRKINPAQVAILDELEKKLMDR